MLRIPLQIAAFILAMIAVNAFGSWTNNEVACFSDPKIFAKMPREYIGLPVDIKPSQMKLAQWVELFLKLSK